MASPNEPATTSPSPSTDDVREAEQADEAKTADDAPAPVHSPQERKVLVRDAQGRDPYGDDRIGPDGARDEVELGKAPHELPDPLVAALRDAKRDADQP